MSRAGLLSAFLACVAVLAAHLQAEPARGPQITVRRIAQTPSVYTGYIGVSIGDIDSERANTLKLGEERGVEIKAVQEGSPADLAGIQPSDVLLNYNGEGVLSAQQLARMVRETPPGRKVKVQYWRAGKTRYTVVMIAASPDPTPFMPAFPSDNWPTHIDTPRPLLVWDNSALGIELERIDSQLADFFGVKEGLLVRFVQRGSPADRTGVKAGDVIFSVGQQRSVDRTRLFVAATRKAPRTCRCRSCVITSALI